MKKKILLLCTFFISLFIFINRISATTMYLDCYIDDRCKDTGTAWYNFWSEWECQPYLHTFVLLTDNEGSANFEIISEGGGAYFMFENEDNCWLKGDFKDLGNSCDDDTMYEESYDEILNAGYCPIAVRSQKGFNIFGSNYVEGETEFVPLGKNKNHKSIEIIEKTEYIIYSIIDKNGNRKIIAEGYGADGAYSYLGPNFKKFWNDEIYTHQKYLIRNLGGDYYKVATNFDALMISGKGLEINDVSICTKGKEDCINNHGFELIIDSNDSNGRIYKSVEEWFNVNEETLDQYQDLIGIASNEKLVNSCQDLNNSTLAGKKYNFSSDYTVEEMIGDLEKAYNAIEKAYSEESSFYDYTQDKYGAMPLDSATTYIYKNSLGIKEIIDLAEKEDTEYYINKERIVEGIQRDIKEKLNEFMKNDNYKINIIDATEDLKEYTTLFYTTISYLDANPLSFHLNSMQITRVGNLKEKFEALVREKNLNIYPVVDCKSLLGKDLIDKINSYLNIIKIAVPIILIAFGIIEFTKAVFAGDEESMKKAQKSFIRRLFIAVLIFLTPTFVNLLLSLANKVWLTISPNACGLFGS